MNAVFDGKVTEHSVHRSFLLMGQHIGRMITVPMLTTATRAYSGHQNWTMEQRKKWPGPMKPVFYDIMWSAGCECVNYQEKRWHRVVQWEDAKLAEAGWCFGLCAARIPWVLLVVGILLCQLHLPTHCCRPRTPLDGNSILETVASFIIRNAL